VYLMDLDGGPDANKGEVTQLLQRWSGGDQKAFDELAPVIYKQLRKLAHYHLQRERDGHTLQSTALVHEVYLRLCGENAPRWENRAHFFALAARLMRRILVDYARMHIAEKRGGITVRVELEDPIMNLVEMGKTDLVALDDAMQQLEAVDARKCRVVEARFFAGLSAKEIATVLGTTEATVRRDWRIARAWLYRYLESEREQ
jgi:RNA polymerase sigma factor (TIGR02999 family)